MNSLGLDRFITNVTDDFTDGIVLIQVFEKLSPGIVSWDKVKKKARNKFQKLGNCNYAVGLGRKLNFSIVNIAGTDFVEKNRKLILALVWQACKHHLLSVLQVDGTKITEDQVVEWANKMVQMSGQDETLSSIKDKSVSNSHFLAYLLDAVEPNIVNQRLMKHGKDDEEKEMNAKYVIGLARKIGCFIFLVWEDIVEAQPKMIFAFLASLMKWWNEHKT